MKNVLFVLVAAFSLAAAGRLDKDESTRMGQERHFQGGKHNPEYDQEAFLGKELKKTFEQLTTKERKRFLGTLADKIDKDRNGSITYNEMKGWISQRGKKFITDDATRLWKFAKTLHAETLPEKEKLVEQKTIDMNEPMTWEMYKYSKFRDADINDPKGAKIIERERRRWNAADANKDNRLSFEEYKAVLHPEEFDHTKIVHIHEMLDHIDNDKDGYVSLDENLDYLYSPEERKKRPDEVQRDIDAFKKVRDKNNDGKLDMNELWEYLLGPIGFDLAGHEAEHLMTMADDNKDGILSKNEILAHHDMFVGSAATDYGQVPHDEI